MIHLHSSKDSEIRTTIFQKMRNTSRLWWKPMCKKKKKKNPSQQHWVAQPLDLVFLHALHCILSKTSNRELVWATFPHPQALNGREWQGVKKKRSMYSGNWKLIHNTYAPTHSKKWTDTVNQLQLMLTFHNFW